MNKTNQILIKIIIILLIVVVALIIYRNAGFLDGTRNIILTEGNFKDVSSKFAESNRDSDDFIYFTYAYLNYAITDTISSAFSGKTSEEIEKEQYKNIYGKTINDLIQDGKQLMENNNITPKEYRKTLENYNSTGLINTTSTIKDTTEEILANYLEVNIDHFSSITNEYGFTETKLPVTIKNKSSETRSFIIQIEAIDSNGSRINSDYIYANNLNPEQKQSFELFQFVPSNKIQALENSIFKIVEIKTY